MQNPVSLSQTSLMHFEQCKRRFWLKYIEQIEWPAPVSPQSGIIEEALKKGAWFHQLIEQEQLGMHVDPIVDAGRDEDLKRWWKHYREQPPLQGSPRQSFTEITLAASIPPLTLTARYDRIVVDETGQCVIVDWKTGRHKPDPEALRNSWQTRVYLYVLAEVEHQLPLTIARPLKPEDLRLVYWYAEHPQDCTWISYTGALHEQSRKLIGTIVEKIMKEKDREAFPMTEHRNHCRLCTYQTFCNRKELPTEVEIEWDEAWLADLVVQEFDNLDLI